MNYINVRFLAVIMLVVTACQKDDNNESENSPELFQIYNLGVRFDGYDETTGKAGDFVFTPDQDKVFLEFGHDIIEFQGEVRDNPCFEYHVSHEAEVIALTDSKVIYIKDQEENDDYEIITEAAEGFSVAYDHILNKTVAVGDSLHTGDVVGNPGPWQWAFGRVEVQINYPDDADGDLSFCPFVYMAPSLKEEYQSKVLQLMNDWEAFKGDTTIYDQRNHFHPGCTHETAVP